MKRVTLISAGFLLVMVGLVSADGEIQKVKLSFTKGRNVFKLNQPVKFEKDGYPFENPSQIYGADVSIRTKRKGKNFAVTLGSKGSSGRKSKLYQSKPILFSVSGTRGDKKATLPLILDNITVSRSGGLRLKKYPGWAMKGSFERKSIYLIDANLDGQFDTDGQDYIAFGSVNAIKFCKQTSINGKFYNMSVTSDGSELTLEEVKPENLCKVTLKKGFRGWRALVLSNAEGTYNIAAKKCDVVPAGEYTIDYGLYGKTSNTLYLKTGASFNPQLSIRENNVNTINIGAPFSLNFTATLSNKKVTVNPHFSVAGCYGEIYIFNTSSRRKLERPAIAIFAGKKMVNSGKMGYG